MNKILYYIIMNKDLIECENRVRNFMLRNGELRHENNELKDENKKLIDEIQRLEELNDAIQYGDRTSSVGGEISDRTSSVGSNLSDRTLSFGSEISDTTGIDEEEHTVNLEVQISLDESSPDYKENINLRVTNKDKIDDIKQNILKKISLKNLIAEQIIIIDSHSGVVIKENNPNLLNLFKNGNVSVVVVDKQHDFLSESLDMKGGSYKRRKSKRRKSKRRKSKKRKRRNKTKRR